LFGAPYLQNFFKLCQTFSLILCLSKVDGWRRAKMKFPAIESLRISLKLNISAAREQLDHGELRVSI